MGDAESSRLLAECWRDIHGKNNWAGMLSPLDPLLRVELIRYGKMANVCYDAFESSRLSSNFGSCKFDCSNFFQPLEMQDIGYKVTSFITSKVSVWGKITGNTEKWIGYVAVSNNEKSKDLGRRDITIAWRGTKTISEWRYNFKNILKPISLNQNSQIKVQLGFLNIYTKKNKGCKSARDQILDEVKRLIKVYPDEELSISITGHSLGSALAILSAYDIVEKVLNEMNDERAQAIPVCVFSFSGPRVGNAEFRRRLELRVKVLRVVNVNDIVPQLPGILLNEKLPEKIMKLVQRMPWCYTHVGVELSIGQKIDNPYWNNVGGLISAHKMETLLRLLEEDNNTA